MEGTIIFHISQAFLPGGGGLEKSIDVYVRELNKEFLNKIIILTLKNNNLDNDEFDKNYPVKIIREKGLFFKNINKLQLNYNSVTGGDKKINFTGKLSMLLVVLFDVYNLFLLTFRNIFSQKNKIIVHVYGFSSLAVIVIIKKILFLKKIDIVFSDQFVYQKSGFYLADKIISLLLKNCSFICCVSNYSKDLLEESFNIKNVSVCHNWVEESNINSKEIIKSKSNNLKILFVGRVVPEKGINLILDLARFINKQKLSDKYSIEIVGDSNHSIVSEVIQEAAINSALKYSGRLEGEELIKCYQSSNVFLMPVTQDEGFGRVILESYIQGLPVIATPLGAIPEVLKFFKCFRLINPENIDFKLILRSMDDLNTEVSKVGKNEFKKNCEIIIRENFSSDNFKVYVDFYQKTIGKQC